MKKWTKAQKKVLNKMWKEVCKAQFEYEESIDAIETYLQEKLCVDVEVFHVDGEAVGYGTYDREYKLWQP